VSAREREIARLGLVYGAKGWEPLAPDHKPGVIDPVGSILLEVDGTHPPEPIPMYLTCPKCNERHIDEGEFRTRSHATHACQKCGLCWRPAVAPTVGVWFLPGFKNEPQAFMTFKVEAAEPALRTYARDEVLAMMEQAWGVGSGDRRDEMSGRLMRSMKTVQADFAAMLARLR